MAALSLWLGRKIISRWKLMVPQFHSSTVYSVERMQNISLKWFLKMLIMADADYKWYWKHHQFIQNYIFWKVTKQKYNHSISCLELKMKNVKCGWKVWVTRFSPWASEINIAIHLNLFLSPLPAFFALFPDLRPLWRPLWPKTLAKNLERHEKCFIFNASWNMSTSLEELPLNSEQPLEN